MTIMSMGAAYNEDGTYLKVNDQGIVEEYAEIYQEELIAALEDRVAKGDFTKEQLDALWDAYYDSYCQEQDFINIKSLGLNTVRLPMYYRNFMEGPDDALVMKEDAFERVDWFLEMAKKHGLFVILDMHGVVGGQSGFEHSGTRDREFWDNEIYQQEMCTLWKNIALHYINDRPDLAYTILAYDLVNEPATATKPTGKTEWNVMDKMYDAIREVDEYHVISIEGVWYPISLPDPSKYGWENVLYQYHFYNWFHDKGISNDMFYTFMKTLYMFSDYNVPKLVGEFNFFNNKDAWKQYLNLYDTLGWGWTTWSYKIISVGWWDSSWGLVVQKMFLENDKNTPIEDYRLKMDIRTASYEQMMNVWSHEQTNYGTQDGYYKLYKNGVLYNVLKDYFGEKCKVDTSKVVD
jgi:aryl-phospho-beta-D-glucosidase BglC (GH1 family)